MAAHGFQNQKPSEQEEGKPDPEESLTDLPEFETLEDRQFISRYQPNPGTPSAASQIRSYISIFLILLAGIVAFVFWSRSSATSDTTRMEREAKEKAEAALFSDLARAWPELEARLRQRIIFRKGVTIIRDPLTATVYGLPVSNAWKIECGVGLLVEFPGLGEQVYTVELTDTMLTADKCTELIPLVSNALISDEQR
jgi:hypothetical protein